MGTGNTHQQGSLPCVQNPDTPACATQNPKPRALPEPYTHTFPVYTHQLLHPTHSTLCGGTPACVQAHPRTPAGCRHVCRCERRSQRGRPRTYNGTVNTSRTHGGAVRQETLPLSAANQEVPLLLAMNSTPPPPIPAAVASHRAAGATPHSARPLQKQQGPYRGRKRREIPPTWNHCCGQVLFSNQQLLLRASGNRSAWLQPSWAIEHPASRAQQSNCGTPDWPAQSMQLEVTGAQQLRQQLLKHPAHTHTLPMRKHPLSHTGAPHS
jgi:hypothetical protein